MALEGLTAAAHEEHAAFVDDDRADADERRLGKLALRRSVKQDPFCRCDKHQFVTGHRNRPVGGPRGNRMPPTIIKQRHQRRRKMAEFTLRIDGMHCGSCVRRVSQALAATPGVAVNEVRVGAARLTAAEDPRRWILPLPRSPRPALPRIWNHTVDALSRIGADRWPRTPQNR
jgi:hypothetical protein